MKKAKNIKYQLKGALVFVGFLTHDSMIITKRARKGMK